jgi:hypothetical protein
MRISVLSAALTVILASVSGAAEGQSSKVDGTFAIPKNVPTFAGHAVDIRLYEFDPFLADVSATLIDQVELKGFGHTKGKETGEDFVLGAKGTVKPRMSYYVTLFILKDGKRTHMGRVPSKALAKVLTDGKPRTIKMVVTPVR